VPASGRGADADSFIFRNREKSKAARALPLTREARRLRRVKAALEKNCLRVSAQGDGKLVPKPRSVKRKEHRRRDFRTSRRKIGLVRSEGGFAPRPEQATCA
jgi:hypothetical protein